ncbi:hypothetical protein CEXT_356051 [Caerostris extrusa]|uniref:Uncharacterized protein n=1 Tax=Caerostris extrusa TaxID=172846 RepID=A0AAV4QZR8_CAEEX|nr:hypothetical protein CEXT_356051 [Caerostris extrusa]
MRELLARKCSRHLHGESLLRVCLRSFRLNFRCGGIVMERKTKAVINVGTLLRRKDKCSYSLTMAKKYGCVTGKFIWNVCNHSPKLCVLSLFCYFLEFSEAN